LFGLGLVALVLFFILFFYYFWFLQFSFCCFAVSWRPVQPQWQINNGAPAPGPLRLGAPKMENEKVVLIFCE